MKLYGKASKEEDLILESSVCREIISKIMDFGVTQHQIQSLIKMLAMELEDRKVMMSVLECFKSGSTENAIEENKIIT